MAIENASVSLGPSDFMPVTANVDGVYAFPAVENKDYRVSVEANGYEASFRDVSIQGAGELVSIAVPLTATSGPGEGPRVGCFGDATHDGNSSSPLGDSLLVLNLLLLLTMTGAMPARRETQLGH